LLEAKFAPFTRDRIKPEKNGINDASQGMKLHWVWRRIIKKSFELTPPILLCGSSKEGTAALW